VPHYQYLPKGQFLFLDSSAKRKYKKKKENSKKERKKEKKIEPRTVEKREALIFSRTN
jgi:hypothetical protein